MAGRTTLMADKGLNLYNGLVAQPPLETYVGIFTTAPTVDDPLAAVHLGVEWGPARIRVFPNSSLSAPRWGLPEDFTDQIRQITNLGSLSWASIGLTSSPSTAVAFGVFDSLTGDNLLSWGPLNEALIVTDGEDRVFGTGDLRIQGD